MALVAEAEGALGASVGWSGEVQAVLRVSIVRLAATSAERGLRRARTIAMTHTFLISDEVCSIRTPAGSARSATAELEPPTSPDAELQ
ncbi:hypothetical protein GCM10009616_40630 [Microlunatus lacustris]